MKNKKYLLLIIMFLMTINLMANTTKNEKNKEKKMNRIELAQKKVTELFGEMNMDGTHPDQDMMEILQSFIFGEVFYQGSLTDKEREMITLVVLTTNQTLPQLKAHVIAALNTGLTPVEIKEAVYQSAPYIGFPKVLNALDTVNEIFKAKGIELPVESQKTVNEDTRLEKGIEAQVEIFGEFIYKMRENAPENLKHIQDYLSAYCFGDIYTRNGLNIKQRELLTFCILVTLGTESQMKSHIIGNINVGNNKEVLIDAVTQCLPYIGFPRTLNALNCINEVLSEK